MYPVAKNNELFKLGETMRWTSYKDGDIRTRNIFCLFPLSLRINKHSKERETRWLEKATIVEKYYTYSADTWWSKQYWSDHDSL